VEVEGAGWKRGGGGAGGGGALRTQLVAAAVGVRGGGREREKNPKVGQRKSRTGEGAAVRGGEVAVLAFAVWVMEGSREGRGGRQEQLAAAEEEEEEVGRRGRTASPDAEGGRGIAR
jgi:hypothetical protein